MTIPKVDGGGERKNAGKVSFDLVPTDALFEVAKVFNWGASKYASRNWERGMKWSISYNSMMRHILAWHAGEDNDQESGLSHMAHVAVNAMFLIAYQLRGLRNLDDREHLNRMDPRALIHDPLKDAG